MQIDDIRQKFERFRILVIGRANAGKTTLLKQICNSKENPEIYDGEGKKVDPAQIKESAERGEHNIENEMVFRSNPGFVFHDSRGFEAGSVDEFNKMKDFVAERAKTTFLKKRVHAIWYCIPMDQMHRAILTAEEMFFDECETGNVPVVVVFTKCDALQVLAVAALTTKDKELPEQERLAKVKELEESMLQKSTIWERLQKRKNPPKVYAEVKDMHKFNEGCRIVLEKTAAALNDESLEMLFVTTQSANIMLCVKYAVDSRKI
ncbi:GTP-binding protein [Chiua virens]|nr:GTP-binding protein [Chiua virens]